MTMPGEFHQPRPVNARLVTKTSLPHPKPAIALLLALWHAAGKPASLEYGISAGAGLVLDESLLDELVDLFGTNAPLTPGRSEIEKWVAQNPLLTAQLEALNAAFELIWHLGSFSFAGKNLNRSAERSGGKRLPKLVEFTTNLDIIDACVERDMAAYTSVLLNWLSNGSWQSDSAMESSLIKTLAAFAEVSFYKTGKGDDGIVYTPHNVYNQFVHGDERVDLSAPGQERQGPTRIFAALVKDNLNPYLASAGQSVEMARSITPDAIQAYSRRAATAIGLSRLEIAIREHTIPDTAIEPGTEPPRNLIVFGAPGTGKSHDLDLRAKANFPGNGCITRVTFHPEYTYSQFVGAYKPWVELVENPEKSLDQQFRDSKITYRYEFGPFMETYVQALLHPNVRYVLLIEELNRANPAAAFGDIFQLLDRDTAGASKYPIATPNDMRGELWKRLYESSFFPEGDNTLFRYSNESAKAAARQLSLPPNMFIWATMNSADQGVFPMDTAFKRRWSFEYMDINHKCEVIRGFDVVLGENAHVVNWDGLRRKINELLLNECKVNEDKLLGPFFIAPEALDDPETFAAAFKDKVLLYLCEDAAKMKKPNLFKGCDHKTLTYSRICDEFDARGEEIFGLSLAEE
ncbi:AAA family ATPase [Parvibacter caecicola]|uniref:AAA family ATPase n=1 Tax=Parvibacter caecicola TaxID=747645 RepID=UPI002731ACFA|nr:AAA family ATPase [Parvibacter caecicola]